MAREPHFLVKYSSYLRTAIKLVLYILKQLFASVSVNSGGYLPRRRGSVNIHRYSPTLRRIIVEYPCAGNDRWGGSRRRWRNKRSRVSAYHEEDKSLLAKVRQLFFTGEAVCRGLKRSGKIGASQQSSIYVIFIDKDRATSCVKRNRSWSVTPFKVLWKLVDSDGSSWTLPAFRSNKITNYWPLTLNC